MLTAPVATHGGESRFVFPTILQLTSHSHFLLPQEFPVKILIVDDSRAMRLIVKRTLRKAGFKGHDVVEAENGHEALEKALEEEPDLILSDWHMPEMSGMEFLESLTEEGRETCFGFVTSESTPEMRKQATEAGANFLLAKPFTPDNMAQTLESALDE
jgi:two-component system chemotaxis response regulator CheY